MGGESVDVKSVKDAGDAHNPIVVKLRFSAQHDSAVFDSLALVPPRARARHLYHLIAVGITLGRMVPAGLAGPSIPLTQSPLAAVQDTKAANPDEAAAHALNQLRF
jgi:hypothetical protein